MYINAYIYAYCHIFIICMYKCILVVENTKDLGMLEVLRKIIIHLGIFFYVYFIFILLNYFVIAILI